MNHFTAAIPYRDHDDALRVANQLRFPAHDGFTRTIRVEWSDQNERWMVVISDGE